MKGKNDEDDRWMGYDGDSRRTLGKVLVQGRRKLTCHIHLSALSTTTNSVPYMSKLFAQIPDPSWNRYPIDSCGLRTHARTHKGALVSQIHRKICLRQ